MGGRRLDPMGPAALAVELLERDLLTDGDELLAGLVRLAEDIIEVGDRVGGLSPHGPDRTISSSTRCTAFPASWCVRVASPRTWGSSSVRSS